MAASLQKLFDSKHFVNEQLVKVLKGSTLCENFFKHKSHLKQFSFVWALALRLRLCLASIHLCGKFFGHTWHSNGLMPLCFRTWLKKWLFWENRLEQSTQPNGFSIVCVRKCLSRLHCWENLLKQCWHVSDFIPLWLSMCLNKSGPDIFDLILSGRGLRLVCL